MAIPIPRSRRSRRNRSRIFRGCVALAGDELFAVDHGVDDSLDRVHRIISLTLVVTRAVPAVAAVEEVGTQVVLVVEVVVAGLTVQLVVAVPAEEVVVARAAVAR